MIVIGGFVFGIMKCAPSQPPPSTPSVGVTQVAVTPSASQSEPRESLSETVCLDVSAAIVDCGLDHRYQSMPLRSDPAAECSESNALQWLGYVRGIDVVRFGVTAELGHDRCFVDGLGLRRGDFADVLNGPNGRQWRYCVMGDIRVPQSLEPVSCDVPHVGEYLGVEAVGVVSQDQCIRSAREYIGRSDLEGLTIYSVNSIGTSLAEPRCLAAVTSGRELVDSLRRLGNANLPRAAG